jgi:hypothetical protein
MAINILTKSGGEINLIPSKSGIKGNELYIHVDQTANINTGEGDATIGVTVDECKRLIDLLNEYVAYVEGRNYIAIIDYSNNNGKDINPIDIDIITPLGDSDALVG